MVAAGVGAARMATTRSAPASTATGSLPRSSSGAVSLGFGFEGLDDEAAAMRRWFL